MLGFVTAYSPLSSDFYREQYARCAGKGIAGQPASRTVIVDAAQGLAHAYESAKPQLHGVDGAVFLHADLEILDPLFTEKVRLAFENPEVAIVGLIGARRLKGIDWWNGEDKVGRMHHGKDWGWPGVYFPTREGDVHAVDGCIVALSPWALENLSFDPVLAPWFHGWEVDICTLARSKGKRVRVIDSEARHHTKGGLGDAAAFADADKRFRAKWKRFLLYPKPCAVPQ